MDKFGFFNLLNSFFPLSNQNQQQKDQKNPNPADLLTDIFSSLSTKNQAPSSSPSPANTYSSPQKEQVANKPLQQNMLLTMANHDNFVKRVNNKHKN